MDKEVYFYKYCNTCNFSETPASNDPCNDCLSNPKNEDSHKPVNWEAKK
jgi:hypothetical protein